MAWLYKVLRSGATTPKTIFFSAPRNHLLCFFFPSVFAAEIPALEVLAISVFTTRCAETIFFAYLAQTVVTNIHSHLRSFTLSCPSAPCFLHYSKLDTS